ncbi:hypothetical protein [Radiobacillus sp. PE A8.2]|uniref:hypothetical protein n=1 Tax=Radiobacillus sp. PE A8.2 TaxID=3380349 RepID=UPI0038910291
MYGKIVASDGVIELGEATEKEISFEKPLSYLSIIIEHQSKVFINGDPDGICLPMQYTQPLVLRDVPIWKLKVARNGTSLQLNNNDDLPYFGFYYYGMY